MESNTGMLGCPACDSSLHFDGNGTLRHNDGTRACEAPALTLPPVPAVIRDKPWLPVPVILGSLGGLCKHGNPAHKCETCQDLVASHEAAVEPWDQRRENMVGAVVALLVILALLSVSIGVVSTVAYRVFSGGWPQW